MADPTSDRDKARAESEAAEIEREMELLQRHRAQGETGLAVRRLILTVVTTALIALALWLAMR
jgi:hypothetical protein